MTPCHLCDREPLTEDCPFCVDCAINYALSPEGQRDRADWEATGGVERPNPDPWWPRSQTAAMDYVRRVQAERRNGGAA